jgi:hypothetical protein
MFAGNRDFALNDHRKFELIQQTEAHKYFRIYKTILDIMSQRGYIVPE